MSLLLRPNNFYFSTRFRDTSLIYKKSNSFVYIFAVNCQFPKYLRHSVPFKAESWHALSHEQYFSKQCFLDICRCAFKVFNRFNKKQINFLTGCLYETGVVTCGKSVN